MITSFELFMFALCKTIYYLTILLKAYIINENKIILSNEYIYYINANYQVTSYEISNYILQISLANTNTNNRL